MSSKAEALSDSSDSEAEKKLKAKLRKDQKKSTKRKQTESAETPEPKRTQGSTSKAGGDKKEEKISLGKMKYVTVREFKNKLYVDIREHYEKDGQLLPGKKGVSLPAEQWQNLKSVIGEIDERIQQMC